MANYIKKGVPALFILVFLAACSAPTTIPVYKPGTADLPTPTEDQGSSTPTPQPMEEKASPTPEEEEIDGSCQDETGNVQVYEIPWDDEKLTGRVYTPPCYEESELDYPTLYLLHGHTATDQQWVDLGLIEVVDGLISREEIPPLIIILPKEETWISLEVNYFADHLVQALIPWIDTEYRTLAERDFRAVGGISRGGNWAIRLGLLNWESFGALGAHSAPLFYKDLFRVPAWLEEIPRDSIPLIYLDISEGDMHLAEAEALHEVLRKAGIPHEWNLYPGLHNYSYWSSHLEEYLLWYSAGWSDR